MLKLFRRKKEPDVHRYPGGDKAATLMAKAVLQAQTAWANWLSIKERRLTIRQKKQALVVFCTAMGLLASFFLYRGLYIRTGNSQNWLKPPGITFPADTRLPDSLDLDYLRELTKQRKAQQEYDSIHH